MLDEFDEHHLVPSLRTDELNLGSDASAVRLEGELFDGSVDRLLRHRAVSCPFPSGDREETTLRDIDQVVTNEGLGVLRVGILDERPQSRPCRENVSATNSDIRREVVANFVEDELDLLLFGNRVLFNGSRSVGGTGDRVSLPGEEEDDTSVGSGRIDETDLGGSVVVGKGDVYSRSGSDDVLCRGFIELTDTIREGTGGIDDTLEEAKRRHELHMRVLSKEVRKLTLDLVSHSRPVITSRILHPLIRPSESLRRSTTSVWFAATAPYWTAVKMRAMFIRESLC